MPIDTVFVVVAVVSMFAVFAFTMLWVDYYSRDASAATGQIKDGQSHL